MKRTPGRNIRPPGRPEGRGTEARAGEGGGDRARRGAGHTHTHGEIAAQ